MDVAYDHVQEEAFSPSSPVRAPAAPAPHDPPAAVGERPSTPTLPSAAPAGNNDDPKDPHSPSPNTDLRTAFKTFQSSPWGSAIGGWLNTARKQGETFVEGLQKEAAEAVAEGREQATKGFERVREQVVSRTRGLSLTAAGEQPGAVDEVPGEEGLPEAAKERSVAGSGTTGAAAVAEAKALEEQRQEQERSAESLSMSSADIVREAGTLVASLKSTAASRLKDLQRAEDAADEALLKFGANVRNFLRDAVTITAPDDATKGAERELLFETQEPGTGRKVVHATRLDAQLHAIHNAPTTFTEDPAQGDKWQQWTHSFDIGRKTDDIAKDLDRYEELRRAMEKFVPETVEYRTFWMRYYFLRQAIEEEEARRREVLKGAAAGTQEISWDEDSEVEEDSPTPNVLPISGDNTSTTTLNAPAMSGALKPRSPRRSHEDEKRSVADSDASYDIVSGATSRAPGSPKEEKKDGKEDSDDDWE